MDYCQKEEVSKIAELKDRLETIQPVVYSNQAATSLQLALEAICEVIVSKLGYEAAWTGLNDGITLEVKQTPDKRADAKCSPPVLGNHRSRDPDDGSIRSDARFERLAKRNCQVSYPSTRSDKVSSVERSSAISFPLKVRDSVIGTLGVYSNKEDTFSAEEARILEIFSETAALAIEKANVNLVDLKLGITKKFVDPGCVYLFRGSLEELLQSFKSHLQNGWSGLLVSGRSSDEIQVAEQLKTVPTFQITGDAGLVNAVWTYSGLTIPVSSFMRATDGPLVIIDKLEELERSPQRGYLHVSIEDLRGLVKEVNGAAIIRMESIEKRWFDILEKYCRFF
nr:GAF domain-containing protein [Candidatus Njordarchaeota archaeon]